MKLLKQLTKFYQNEANGLGHYQEDLQELAWNLAEVLERAGTDSNACKNEDRFNELLHTLRTAPTVVAIDTAVNHAHQGLLDAMDRSGEESELMVELGGDIVEYLLNRERILEEQGW